MAATPAPDSLSTSKGTKVHLLNLLHFKVDSLTSVPLGKAPIVASKHQNIFYFLCDDLIFLL